MPEASTASRRIQAAIIGVILLGNLIIACALYETAGWHYLRGYRDVTTFVIVPVILVQAAMNLAMGFGAMAIAASSHRSQLLRPAAIAHWGAALLLPLSLAIAPRVGAILKYNLVVHTPIVEAAGYQDGKLVKILLESGVDPNTRGRPGLNATALHSMAASGNTEIVELLLAKGADPNARANVLHTYPLHGAVFSKAPQSTILALLRHGANPHLRDQDGRTAIELAGFPEPYGSWLRKTLAGTPHDPLPQDAAEAVQPVR